jgi:hypothetical protein
MNDSTHTIEPKSGRRIGTTAVVLVLVACVLAGAGLLGRGKGYKTRVSQLLGIGRGTHPSVMASRPSDHQINVLPDAFLAFDVRLPNRGRVVDANTLNDRSVRLYRTGDQRNVAAVVNTSGGGDSIVLKPIDALELNTDYTFEVTPGVKDTGGASFRPYIAHFTTAASTNFVSLPIAFDKVSLPATQGSMFTCVEIGPDHKLYASTLDGRILRFVIRPDGTLDAPQIINTIPRENKGPRLITGIKFDPSSTPDSLTVWVNHGQLPPLQKDCEVDGGGMMQGADDWSGKLSCLTGPDLDACTDYLVHLPRAWKDHLNNQIVFGPDGALYFCQAGNSAMGAPDHKWGFRSEHLLTCAVLRLDTRAVVNPPLDVKTDEGGHYDPFAPGAPLTVYASGIRNCFDLLWHSNGSLYAGVNGSAAGGNTPGTPDDLSQVPRRIDSDVNGTYTGPRVPALKDLRETEDDFLFRIEKGGYYGHPNASRGEYVLDGGNLGKASDPAEFPDYPVGTQPDRNWRGYLFSFGKNLSPCGVIEYHNDTFGGALKGMILYVRYSGGDDIIALSPENSGSIKEAYTGIRGFTQFVNPVDLTEDVSTGNLYVAELGGKRITLLRPASPAQSTRVCVQSVAPPHAP